LIHREELYSLANGAYKPGSTNIPLPHLSIPSFLPKIGKSRGMERDDLNYKIRMQTASRENGLDMIDNSGVS
jgi:hypothetical protein